MNETRNRIGVGYSYADYGQKVETTDEAAKDIQAFVALFFDTFSSFKGRPFHLSGESYGVCTLFVYQQSTKTDYATVHMDTFR